MNKPEIILIAAMTANHVIGKDNDLAVKSKSDMKHFKETTMGHPVIMGRKTFESMGNYLLPGRFNYLLTRDSKLDIPAKLRKSDIENNISILDAMGRGKFEDVLEALSNPNSKMHATGKAFVIGGGEIYEKFISLADVLILTVYPIEIEGDTYFPQIPENLWELTESKSLIGDNNSQDGVIRTYKRRKF